MGCVYVVTCIKTGKQYVGKTIYTMECRRKRHILDAKSGSNFIFHRALIKYGYDNFNWEERYTSEYQNTLLDLEVAAIQKLKTKHPYGYNMTDGGDGFIGASMSDEHKAKISRALTGRTISQEARKKISESHKGKPSHRKGKKSSEETRKRLSESCKGRRISEETKIKISKKLLGRVSPMKGKKHSAYSKSLTSQSLLGIPKSRRK